jgi:small-conductance mechanosensitive channel
MIDVFINNSLGLIDKKTMSEFLSYGIAVLAFFIGLITIYSITNSLLRKIERNAENDLAKKVRTNLKVPVILLIIILSIWVPFSIMKVSAIPSNAVNQTVTILVIATFSWILIRLVKLMKFLVLKKYDIEQKDNLKARKVYTQFRIIERVLVFVILIIAISLSLMTFSEIRRIGISIIASAGVTGIILGLAAQKMIAGVLAGIQLALTQPIRLDDVVVVENEWGKIEEINLTYVVVRIWDERRLILPTSYFIEKPFQNWTRTNSDILGTVFIYTDYSVPFEELREELTRLVKNSSLWDGKVNVLQVTNTTEKTVEIRALVSAVDSSTAWDLRVYVRENMISFLQHNYPDSLPKSRVLLTNDKKA